MTTHIAKLEQQYLLEAEMRDAGVTRYLNLKLDAANERLETATDAGLHLLKRAIEPLIQAVEGFIRDEQTKGRGRKHIALPYLMQLEPEVVAFLTAKGILNAVSSHVALTKAAITIAKSLEDELRFRHFQTENQPFYDAVHKRIHRKTSYDYKRTVLIHSMGKVGMAWESWSKTDKVHIGILCIDLMAKATGLIDIVQIPKRKDDTAYYVVPTQAALDWLEKEHSHCALLAPTHLPMLVPPKDWTTPYDGGYLGVLKDTLKLVKTHNPKYLEELAGYPMPDVYQAVNHIQQTAWRVNDKVLNVAQVLWDSHSERAGLPSRDDRMPRACPVPKTLTVEQMTPEQQTLFYNWKREAAQLYESNVINRSKRLMFSKTLYVAHKFVEESEIYFPHIMDFRGRVYPVANFLSPQGNDFAKGLLTFAQGKPLENQQAANWLAIHGANLYGKDKLNFEERIAFVEAFTSTIQAIAHDPLANLEWTEAKKPWQFLAFCFEWAGYKREGYAFVSRLPIALDGTCNGLQHFSAMLRDEVGGAAVNLTPSAKPQDIYQRVADVVLEKLKAEVENQSDKQEMAEHWLRFGVTREITKRPVMILPYGGTRLSCRAYIEEHIKKCLQEGQLNSFANEQGDNLFQASQFLAGFIWQSIGEVVIAARQAMDWLQQAARLVSKEALPIQWTTPSGFPVQQAYYDVRTRRIKTQLAGNVIRKVYLCLNETLDTLNPKEQANGISPNFVHSMDAAALHLYVNQAKALGINNFSLVHDSYGTLASDTELSAACIRQVFVSIYRDDVLDRLRCTLLRLLSDKNAKCLPDLPSKGRLDLEAIQHSAFFFA
jgi:DNA-directed RNA polymerase, mitochondrial